MSVDISTIIPLFVLIPFLLLLACVLLASFKQPYVVAYILVGVIISTLGIIQQGTTLGLLGEIGIILLMFFIGMEISLPRLVSKWRVAVLGPLFQVILSILVVFLLGTLFSWSYQRSILIGFIITLSSSAVIIKILEDLKELDTKMGQNILSILIVQDIIVVPLIVVINLMSGAEIHLLSMFLKLGGTCLLGLLIYLILTKRINLPIPRAFIENHELQIFTALAICFGLASLTSLLGISAPLGAFFAGIIVTSYRGTDWVHKSLNTFKIVFVAMFFIYIGTLLNLTFLRNNILVVGVLVLLVFFINTLLNMVILKSLGSSWRESLYAGSLLSQIGEFSFLLGAVGVTAGIIFDYEYNIIISVISLSLLLSPLWISGIKKILKIDKNYIFEEIQKLPRTRGDMHRQFQSTTANLKRQFNAKRFEVQDKFTFSDSLERKPHKSDKAESGSEQKK